MQKNTSSNEYILNVLNNWNEFCKSHKKFKNSLKEILEKNERLEAEIERLTERNFELSEKGEAVCIAFKTVKAEAIKEFAERLTRNITMNNTSDGVLVRSVDYDCLIEDINDLVKEMVGEDNDRSTEKSKEELQAENQKNIY